MGRIQALGRNGRGSARVEAIKALGVYGHPQDYEFLLAGLKSKDPNAAWACAFALYEYGDLRAVRELTGLLQSEDQRLGREVVSCLTHLLTTEGIEALVRCASEGENGEKRKMCSGALESVFKRLGVTESNYSKKSPSEKKALIDAAIMKTEEKYELKAGDRRLSHKDLLKAVAEWKANLRITGGTYEWVEDRHVLAACTPAEIPLLLDVMAACYLRLSDESLYEVQMVQKIVKRIGRARYRAKVGICERVELAQKASGHGR